MSARRVFVLAFALVLALPLAAQKPAKPAKPAAAAEKPKQPELPLKPERKVEFTTDEGTWISVDVSPDGKTILFDLLGDLYTVPLEGGAAQPLMTGMAFDGQARYSPDGQLIAFLSDRDGAENLWIADADGSNPRQLSREKQSNFTSPAWLPDGRYVLVSRRAEFPVGSNEVWLYHVQGGGGVQVTKSKPKPDATPDKWMEALGAVASPDGRFLYYSRRPGIWGKLYNVEFPLGQIVRRDRRTGDEDTITEALGSAVRPLLSPDGSKLVYATRYETETGLRIRDLNTGDERWLKYPVQRDDQESLFTRDAFPGYAFTPDGREVVVTSGGKIVRINVESGQTRTVPFTAQVAQGLGPELYFPERVEDGPRVRVRVIQGPAQSPDGKRLAFSALTHLYLTDIPKGTPRRLELGDTREFQPAWSPDGRWLAYVTWDERGGHIFKVAADGSGAPQQLTRLPAYYRDVAWTPDGSRLVALRAPRLARIQRTEDVSPIPTLALIWLPAEGGEATVILPARGAGQPHFGPERDRVYVYTPGGLVSMRFDGTDRRTHLRVMGKRWFPGPPEEGEGEPADDVRLSPDGAWALARVNSQIYLLAVPRIGGEPPTINVHSPAVPSKRLTDVGADYMAWAEGGQTITWAVGSSFYRRALGSVKFDPPEEEKKEGEEAAASEKKESAEKEKPKPAEESFAEEIVVTLEVPRHTPGGTIVLRGARAITMKGDEVIPDADIVITGNRIAAIGARGSVQAPADARVFDLSGSTIVPGFVDTHAHWFEERRGVLDVQNWNFLANLAYGVTTGRDPQTFSNDAFAYQDLVDIGEMPGPRAFSTGPGIFPYNDFQSAEEARNVIARYQRHYRTKTLKSYMVGNRKQRQWVVAASKELQMMPTTEGGLDLKLDLTHALDGFAGNEHSLPITPLYKDAVEIFARSGIAYTPTLLVAYGGPWAENFFYQTTEVHDDSKLNRFTPHNILDERTKRRPWVRKDEHVFPRLAEQAGKILKAGGRVGIGSHGQLQGLGYHWEMWALAAGNMGNHQVLRSATLLGAEAIGYAQDLGSIEPGKLADLVILARDPLADIRNTNSIRYVMKNGELFEGDTLDQVWPREKKLQPLWWWNDKP